MKAINRNVSVFKPPCQFFGMQDVSEFGLAISFHCAEAFIPIEVVPVH